MGAVVMAIRANLRERRGSALGLAFVTIVAALVPLAAAAGAHRAGGALERMHTELEPYHADIQFEGEDGAPEDVVARLQALPSVEVAGEGASIPARPAGTDLQPMIDSFGHGGVSPGVGSEFERARLDEGRSPGAADEVLLSARMARRLDLEVGDTFTIETFTFDGLFALFEGTATDPDGPTIDLAVVGVGRPPEELTSVDAPAPAFVVDASFFDQWSEEVAHFPGIYLVRLRDGVDALGDLRDEVRAEFGPSAAVNASEEQARIGEAVSFQTRSLWLLAGVSGLAGVAALGQAVARAARAGHEDRLILGALGHSRRERVLTTMGTVLLPVLLGLAVAVVGAWLSSAITSTGPSGRVDPASGMRFEPLTVVAGVSLSLAVVVVTVLITVRPLRGVRHGGHTLERLLVAPVLPPSVAVGVRAAISRRARQRAAPVWSTFGAVVAGITGTAAVLTFGVNLDRLVDEPARHGWPWDLQVALGDELDRDAAREAAQALADDPRIDGATLARIDTLDVDDRSTIVWATQRLEGDIELTVVAGRTPVGPGEIALGKITLDDLDVALGDIVTVSDASGEPVALEVVGQILVPTSENDDPADGATMTYEGLAQLKAPDSGYPDLYVDAARGVDPEVLAADLSDEVVFVTGAVTPPVVSNLELIDGTPRALAAYLGALAVAASAHGLLSSLRSRREEIAVLRSLGFVRRQVRATVHSHASVYAVAGLLVGLPLGIAAGRVVWRLLADELGFASAPAGTAVVLLLVPSALVAMAIIAGVPAHRAGKVRPASILRAE